MVKPSSTIVYTVTAYKGECQDSDTLIVNVEPNIESLPNAQLDFLEDVTICSGESIILKGPTGDTYKWSTGEIENQIEVSPTRTSTYELRIVKEGLEYTDKVTVLVEACSGNSKDEVEGEVVFLVYPNPAIDKINLYLDNGHEEYHEYKYNLFDAQGRLIISGYINLSEKENEIIDIRSFARGTYILSIQNKMQVFSEKIILVN